MEDIRISQRKVCIIVCIFDNRTWEFVRQVPAIILFFEETE